MSLEAAEAAEGAEGAVGAVGAEAAEGAEGGAAVSAALLPVMRPLTNCNVVLDFHRYEDAAYYTLAMRYLRSLKTSDPMPIPEYESQLDQLLAYYRGTRVLHGYGRFRLEVTLTITLTLTLPLPLSLTPTITLTLPLP